MVKAFSDPSTEEKYLKLGFVPDRLSLKLTVGEVPFMPSSTRGTARRSRWNHSPLAR